MSDLVKRFHKEPDATTEWWRFSSYRRGHVGDRVYLFKQGEGRKGIFGIGKIVDGPKVRDGAAQALIKFDKLVDPSIDMILSIEDIDEIVPFSLRNAQASGNSVPEEVDAVLYARVLAVDRDATNRENDERNTVFDPNDIVDDREKQIRAITVRRGQPAFRQALLSAYESRCVITNCFVEEILEAAHIVSYLGTTTQIVSNGLLLRADIHTLFDCYLLSIDPNTMKVTISAKLLGSSYEKLAGRVLRAPRQNENTPSKMALRAHFHTFKNAEKDR